MKPLPEKQRAVLEFIRKEKAERGKFPTMEAIASHMGWKAKQSAKDCVSRLAVKGWLRVVDRVPYGYGWRTIYDLQDPP